MFCTQCGNQIDEGKNFCGNCGARAGRTSDPASDKGTRPFASTTAKTSSANKLIIFVGGIVFVLIAGTAGLYFGTDLLRTSDYPEIPPPDDRPGRSAATAGSPGPMEDRPGRSAATVGASPPMDDRPGRPAGTVGAPPPRDDRPGRPAGTVGGPPPSAARPSSPSVAGRRADAGTYETLRETSVFETPAASSRIVAKIPGGVRVNVVGATGNWLEVRSKSGNPPGFIRRSDATFVERPG
jgi:hypothetical protein